MYSVENEWKKPSFNINYNKLGEYWDLNIK